MSKISPAKPKPYDVAIIGGGVVGCAIARLFTLEGARTILLEKASDILDGASKGNSGIMHTGFDAPVGSLEQQCIAAGYEDYLAIHEKLNLPLIRSGALVLAWSPEEEAILPDLMEQARANGVSDVELLSAGEILALEPEISGNVRAGFRVPREFIIDPWSAPHAYLLQALTNGAELRRDCEVLGGEFDGTHWHLKTTQAPVRAALVINAAGLFGDIVDQRLIGRTDFTIRPRKGQFVLYDKAAAALASHILLPVPTKITKGVVVCRTAFGNLLVGPTAEEQEDRRDAVLVPEQLEALKRRGAEILPGLANLDVTAFYAGLRPASEFKDYQIRASDRQNYITVGGIRSTGLSSALGVAKHVFGMASQAGHVFAPVTDPAWPKVGIIAEDGERDWQCPDNQGIVCHCELVTRREIELVLADPLAPRSLAGLKRRTRVTMGRCQGFYCSGALAELTRDRLAHPMFVEGDTNGL